MKFTNVKTMFTKVATVGLVAGAIALAAPAKAEAQAVVGVGFGYSHPGYYYGPDYYARLRREEARRHAEWVRAHDRFHYGYRGRW
jgi:hypothetical protein